MVALFKDSKTLYNRRYSLPLYLGTQRTVGGRPLMLKCLPSNWEHCSSRKSLRPRGHGSVLQDRNFILRPTQNFPPFRGLKKHYGKITWLKHDWHSQRVWLFDWHVFCQVWNSGFFCGFYSGVVLFLTNQSPYSRCVLLLWLATPGVFWLNLA